VITQGQTIQNRTAVNPAQSRFAVLVAWTAGDVELSLISPSQKVYDRTTTDPAANHHVQANGESFSLVNPEAGQWTIQLFGVSIPGSGEQVGVDINQIPLSAFGPIATMSASTDRGVAPVAIQFSAKGSSGFDGATITSYRWDFGDCSPVDGMPSLTHVFTAAGGYTVAVTVTDSNGQSDTANQDVFVTAYNHAPSASFLWALLDASKPKEIALSAQSSNDIDGQITRYAWVFGDGTSGSGEFPVHPYAKAGTYAVRLTVTDNGGLTGSTCQLVTTGRSLGAPAPCPG
jgi:PKD repeat protein